jgi:hypothetical protein
MAEPLKTQLLSSMHVISYKGLAVETRDKFGDDRCTTLTFEIRAVQIMFRPRLRPGPFHTPPGRPNVGL